MKLSIITAVYNREATVAEAIKSVASQSYDDIEHLIVDGASQDGTMSEVQRLAHPRMTIISEPDHGIYDALNKGIHAATPLCQRSCPPLYFSSISQVGGIGR